jgi:eukaryotic-like serine/threonine-protein kinase
MRPDSRRSDDKRRRLRDAFARIRPPFGRMLQTTCGRCGSANPSEDLSCSRCGEKLSHHGESLTGLQIPEQLPTLAFEQSDDKIVIDEGFQTLLSTPPRLQKGQLIGRRYRVIEAIGSGGMGTVYHVYDERLDRDVALKFIRPEILENPVMLERFRREIQLASTVTHRNVVRVYDLGEAEGLTFLTMQYIVGEDLSALLGREGALPISRATDIFRQICEGLKAAHEQGVTHRDLKPRNIMIGPTGATYLTDFGLATTAGQPGLTSTGHLVGTPSYMSPEQVQGKSVGPQSDIFSLGIILYEMVTGRLPYSGTNVYEVMAQRVHKSPDPVTDSNPNAPLYLQEILNRCLAVEPSVRYQSIDQVLSDLNAATTSVAEAIATRRRRKLRVALAVLSVLVALPTGWWLYRMGATSGRPSGVAVADAPLHQIFVIPFNNRTNDPSLDWYGDGVARLVADGLAQSRFIRVIVQSPAESGMAPRSGKTGTTTSKKTSAAGYVLTGDILPEPSGVALAVRISDLRSGRQVAARRVGGLTPATLITASDEVAATAKQALGLPPTEKVDVFAADFLSQNPKVYRHYIAGLKALDTYHYLDAEQAFQAALSQAPDYTMARYRLAYAMAAGGKTEDALAQIRRANSEASRLSEREAMYVSAAEAYFARRYDEALQRYAKLLARYPYEMEARRFRASIFLDTRHYDQAIEEANVVVSLAPENHTIWAVLGNAYLAKKDFEHAAVALRKYAELEPDSPNAHEMLADFYRSQSELEMAAEEYRRAFELDPRFRSSAIALAVVDALRGRRTEAVRRLQTLASDSSAPPRDRLDAAFELSYVFRALGRFREAAHTLESVESLLRAEKIREALGLSVRGTSLMEVGRYGDAERLIRLAIQRSPGVPTRYLFAKALLELETDRIPDARKTASAIAENALPPSDPDRTEEKAAAYLQGLALVRENRPSEAISTLTAAISLVGYDYAIYRLALAETQLKNGDVLAAFTTARQATASPDPVEPRLDLELDRVRGLLVLSQIRKAMNKQAEAASHARQFLEVWARADPRLPELAVARALAETP